jgi:hypothetical protein
VLTFTFYLLPFAFASGPGVAQHILVMPLSYNRSNFVAERESSMKIRFSHWCALAKKQLALRHDWVVLRTLLVLLIAAQFISDPALRVSATAVGVIVVGWFYDTLWYFAHDVYRVALKGEYGPDRVPRD